jgi:peptidoglycan/LPS O-acetylase OafA/YrhL
VRRILRIWPLFYAAILFAFLTPYILNFLNLPYSNEGYEPNCLMSLLFLENYQMMITDSFPNVSPLRIMWSLCIEEHFYITWGIVFFFLPMKKVPGFIIISLIVANLSRIVYTSFSLASLDFFTNIDYFAFGAIPAWWLIKRKDLIKKYGEVANRWKAIVIFISIVAIITLPQFNDSVRTFMEPIILGPLFASIILFTLPDKNYLKISDQSIFTKLGKYTYGLYLYHTISINFVLQIGKKISFLNAWYVTSISSLLLTILISIISYYIFEKQFLKLKKFFY